jgi:hypothetical protein
LSREKKYSTVIPVLRSALVMVAVLALVVSFMAPANEAYSL